MVSLRLSASHNELDKLACQIPLAPFYSITTTLGPLPTLSGSAQPSVAALYAQLAFAKRQIFILESENALLQEESKKLRVMTKVSLAEVATLQVMLEYAQDEKGTSRLARADKNTISRLEKRLADYRNLVRALAEGHVFDPRIITRAHAGVDDDRGPDVVMVEAIQAAAKDSDSLWSKILPALINTHSSGKDLIATTNLALNLRKDLHEMEKLARFWKLKAMLKSNVPTRTVPSRQSKDSGDFDGSKTLLRPLLAPLACKLGHSSDMAELQNNGAFRSRIFRDTLLPATPTNLQRIAHTLAGPNEKRTNTSLRPSVSDEQSVSAVRAPKRNQVYTKRSRRITFHDSLNLEAQTTEKRHGFLMPCIKSILQKHASAPVNIPLASDITFQQAVDPFEFSGSSLPSTPDRSLVGASPTLAFSTPLHRLSLQTSRALQSAERICATFSSGSLGSLEMSLLSDSTCSVTTKFLPSVSSIPEVPLIADAGYFTLPEPFGLENANTSEHNNEDSRQIKSEKVNPLENEGFGRVIFSSPSESRTSNTDATMAPTTPPPPPRRGNSLQDISLKSSISVNTSLAGDNSMTLPSVKHTVRAPSTNTRVCRSTISTRSPEKSFGQSRISTAHIASTSGLALLKRQHIKTTGRKIEDNNAGAMLNLGAARSSTRLVSMIRTPANTICTPKPRLSFIKSGLAKPTASARSVNPAKNPTSPLSTRMPTVRRTGLSKLSGSHSQVHLCNDMTVGTNLFTSASHEIDPLPKARSQLRVVNNYSKQSTSARPRSQTQPRANIWNHTVSKAESKHSQVDSGDRV